MSNFYIADTHFGHYNIMRLCNRPFKSVEEMDQVMIDNWNRVVSDNDTVYVLGDFCYKSGKKSVKDYLGELNGEKILILGNHDKRNVAKYSGFNGFKDVYDYLEINDEINGKEKRVILFHYPIVEWNGFFRDSIHLFGHIHNNMENDAGNIMSDINGAYNVGADCIGFTPRTLDQIVNGWVNNR